MRKVCINSVFNSNDKSRNSQHPRDREQPMGIKAHSSQQNSGKIASFLQKYTNKIVPTQILFPIITLPHSTDKNSDHCHFVNTRPAPVKPDTTRANWCRLNQRWRQHTDAILSQLQQQNLDFFWYQMSQDAGALTTLRWRTCCHLVQRQSTHNRRCLPWHKCRLPQPQIPTPHNTRTQHALATRPSGPTVPTNNRQDVFANTPSPQPLCPRFYAE